MKFDASENKFKDTSKQLKNDKFFINSEKNKFAVFLFLCSVSQTMTLFFYSKQNIIEKKYELNFTLIEAPLAQRHGLGYNPYKL